MFYFAFILVCVLYIFKLVKSMAKEALTLIFVLWFDLINWKLSTRFRTEFEILLSIEIKNLAFWFN